MKGILTRLKLDISLRKLADPNKYDDVLFWGRITGSQNNYYIALALKFDTYEFPFKRFFYCTDNFEFKPLPALIAQFKDMVEGYNGEFSGDQDRVLWEDTTEPVEDQQNVEPVNDDIDPLKTNEENKVDEDKSFDSEEKDKKQEVLLKKIVEIDRLAFLIRAIEIECAVVPVGSLRLNPKHHLEYNKLFTGLDLNQALDINNWMHFRQPLYKDKKRDMEKAEAIFKKDLLDDLVHDLPNECWTIQSDLSMQLVTARSLKWHGFIGYHRVKSSEFGYCYFGNGVKNVELSLLI